MKKQTSKWTVLAAAMAVAGVFGLITSPAFADVHVSQNGATLTVTAPSTLAGKGLLLQTDAESAGTWTTATNIVGAVPSEGGVYTVDLAALGIANGTPCRIASATCYERLTMLLMDNRDKYIDTGIKGKNVYGVRMGFYPTKRGTAGTADANFALNCGKGGDTSWTAGKGGFHIGLGQNANVTEALEGPVHWGHQGYGSVSSERPNWETHTINHIAFTNRVFTLNGVIVKSRLYAGAISTNDLTVTMGRNNPGSNSNYYSLCGYWSYLQFDDENGELIVDYIPVRRTSDNKVGFWDSVSNSLVVPTKEGQNLSVGEGVATGEIICDDSTLEVVADGIVPNRQLAYSSADGAVTISIPAGLAGESIIIAWDSEDKGDDLAAWTHSATLTDSATAGTITARLGKLGIRNGDCARIFAANVYKPLDLLHATAKTSYIDTGIKDSDVYTVRIKFMPTGQSSSYGNAIGTGEGTDRPGFVVASSGDNTPSNFYRILWAIQGAKPGNRHTITANEMAELEFVDCKCTWNGTTYTSSKTGAVGLTGDNMYVGRSSKNDNTMYADWGYVKFGDKDDNAIFDAIPVQRASDNTVGFYDRATLTFMPSSGSTAFTAGTVTNDTPVVAVNASSAAWEVTDIQGLIIIFK